MFDAWKGKVLALLRIPTGPHVPPGEEAHAEIFRAGRGFYSYLLLQWVFRELAGLIGLVVITIALHSLITGQTLPWIHTGQPARVWTAVPTAYFVALEVLVWILFLGQFALSFVFLTWDFECRFYVLTDRCLRIQEGLWTFREQTFSLANIQDLDVRRGPLQRLLGIGDLMVRTAGGGENHPAKGLEPERGMHVGLIQGVAEPDRIQARLVERMRHHRDPGLGEPARHAPAGDLATAAGKGIAASRTLRASLEKPSIGDQQAEPPGKSSHHSG